MRECPEGRRWRADARKAAGGYCYDVDKGRETRARYRVSEKGRETRARHEANYTASGKRFEVGLHKTWRQRAARIEAYYGEAS